VKTRLEPRLGREGAAALSLAFLEDAGRLYRKPSVWTSVLCAEPEPGLPCFDERFPPPWRRERQSPGDLGEKLAAAFADEFRGGAPAAVAIGSDHPALSPDRLAEAFALLASGIEAVIVPAEDGGYCAIGLAAGAPLREIFLGVPWSTETVLATTLERLDRASVPRRVLAPAYDVDRPEDLDRLRRDLGARDPLAEDFPRATRDALDALEAALP
jgi:rSAM/selenodomain-associated transferase 1